MTTLLTFQHLPLLNNSVISCALTINNVSLWVLTFNLFVNRSIYISFRWHPMQEAVSEEHFSTSDERCHCWCPFALPALPWSIATISNRDLSVMSTFIQQGQKFMVLTFSLSSDVGVGLGHVCKKWHQIKWRLMQVQCEVMQRKDSTFPW